MHLADAWYLLAFVSGVVSLRLFYLALSGRFD